MGPSPAGANDWACKPTKAHPRPVVLVHGTASNMQRSFSKISPQLKSEGYCVFALNYGANKLGSDWQTTTWGVGDISVSAIELAQFVDSVLHSTKAKQVDIVGHSQGGLMARVYLKHFGGANPVNPARNKVHSLIAAAPPNHGTRITAKNLVGEALSLAGIGAIDGNSLLQTTAVRQQMTDSPIVADVNASGETMPGVQYTVIATATDGLVNPVASSFLKGKNVTNVLLQDGCPIDNVRHNEILFDPRAIWFVLGALDPAYAKTNPAPCIAG
ncbi:MAG: alpha/beta fold hydrolase [Nocardiaceae bacterium]|nr:alpha/beta fold hydrolase [Nocardiaceae bacterium]